MRPPILAVFDVDGTLADASDPDASIEHLPAFKNVVSVAEQYIAMEHAHVMICTARLKSDFQPTWNWLNRQLRLSRAPKPVTLVCRPDTTPNSMIPSYKVSEILHGLRRISAKPIEAHIYDDDLRNLRLLNTLRPMVKVLRLFHADNGVITQWSL